MRSHAWSTKPALLTLLVLVASGCTERPPVELRPPADAQAATRPGGSSDFLALAEPSVARPQILPAFTNVAEQAGVTFTFFSDIVPDRYFLPEIMGGGAAWFDFDLDGALDLYLRNGCSLDRDHSESDSGAPSDRLYRSDGSGRFEDVSNGAGAGAVAGRYGQGIAVDDYDADGFPDLYLSNYGRNVLLRNNGDGTFADMTESGGVGDPLWSTSPIWLDVNGDSLLDLYVTNYLQVTLENSRACEYEGTPGYCGPGHYEAAADHVYLSRGDGSFVEAGEELGFAQANGKGLAVAALDFDQDLKPEIYVANDMTDNFLFRPVERAPGDEASSGPSKYENVAAAAGCAVSDTGEHEASMGLACADFDGDQDVDLFVTHYWAHKNTLYRNLGGLVFHDDSRRTRVAATSYETLGFGTVPLDYDQDGSFDLFVTNGHVLGPLHRPNVMPPQLLRNDGSGNFSDISDFAGPYFLDLWLGRGAAGGDFDNDGDLDLLVTHIGRPAALLRNDTRTTHHWLGLDLRTPERMAPVGGRVVVTARSRKIMAPIVAGGSYLCHGDSRILLGLGDHAGPVDVQIFWPSGSVETHTGLVGDRYWRIIEGARRAARDL